MYYKNNMITFCVCAFADSERALVPEGQARRDPPRREAQQHPAGRARQREAVRLRHQRPPRRLQGEDAQCGLRGVHGGEC